MKSLLLALMLSSCIAQPLMAHDWYDYDCCSNKDCSPIEQDRLKFTDEGIVVPSGEVIPYDDKRIRPTPRDQEGFHWCRYMEPGEATGTICLYIPDMGV